MKFIFHCGAEAPPCICRGALTQISAPRADSTPCRLHIETRQDDVNQDGAGVLIDAVQLAHAAAAAGDVVRARVTLQTIAADPQVLASDAIRAMHCRAEAELALHGGAFDLTAQKLRRAVRHWREAGSPVGEAETRIRLAERLVLDDDTASAELELHALESNPAPVVAAHLGRINALRDALRDLRGSESS